MKTIISILLSLLMLFFPGYGGNTEPEEEMNEAIDENSIFYERNLVSDGLESVDYGGQALRIATHLPSEFYIEEKELNQGILIKDALFFRNKNVEDRFNVKLELAYSGTYAQVSDYVTKSVLSASDDFDLYMGMSVEAGRIILKNLFYNWYDIETIDFSKPWWSDSNTSELTVDGVCLIAVSDFNFSSILYTNCMVFNKNLAAAYELGDIYKIVLDGKWTFDKLQEMVKDIYIDNGNGIKDENDFYGIAHAKGICTNTYLWAFDNPICQKDAEGIPQIAIKTEKINNIVNDIYNFFYNVDGVYYPSTAIDSYADPEAMFISGRSIFATATLTSFASTYFNNLEDDYGVIPFPKYKESQTNYKTTADTFHTVLAVPKTVRDPAFVGTIVEALSAETWKTVTPTLYETALKTRYLNNSEAKDVLDIIIDGRTFDFGSVYDGWNGYAFSLQQLVDNDTSTNFNSYYSQRYPTARLQIKSVVKVFEKNK